jgi:hypothetical protein
MASNEITKGIWYLSKLGECYSEEGAQTMVMAHKRKFAVEKISVRDSMTSL